MDRFKHEVASSMQSLMTMYAPIYRKPDGKTAYYLDGFYELRASVHETNPIRSVWQSLLQLGRSPVAVFCAGDKTNFLSLDGNDEIKSVWNASFPTEYCKVRGCMDHRGQWYMPYSSAIVFTDKGMLEAVPVQDMHQFFASEVPGIHVNEHLRFEAKRQRIRYNKLRDDVQFLDLYNGVLLQCQRLEGGRVGNKRKRNCERE